ncbi:hypothetical protein [Pseudomonas sp.]|uniref:hypothetical protein n=1 Tax=Pseudomonas sp. TaxID=306 RepID=UPI00290852C6|nr:hypothetical protein [Pseudomonas sp.]MDU4254530.1 hypothetical protein [Pseudomonas sp.]
MTEKATLALFHFPAPVGIECCISATNATQAAKALCTTGVTLAARGQKYADPADALPGIRKGLKMALAHPGRVFIRESESSDWRELAGNPEDVLLTDRQRHLKTMNNAQIGGERMKQRSLTCDDETWAMFLELGGSRWFRTTVEAAHKKLKKTN